MVSVEPSPNQVGELILGSQLGGQFVKRSLLRHHSEDEFVQAFGKQKLGQAPLGFCPGGGDDEHHRFTAVGRTPQGFLPALAGFKPSLGVEIEKYIVPAVIKQPLLECNRFKFIRARMAQEDVGHV